MAGGTGTRLGAGQPKQMLPLFGKPIMAHTLERFLAFDPDLLVVAVLHPSLLDTWPHFLKENFSQLSSSHLLACSGGAERTESVFHGLELLEKMNFPPDGLVAIHDAVRPFIDQEILTTGFSLAAEKGNAVASVPVKSSLRMVTDTGSRAIDRSQYYHVQTPQIFQFGVVIDCYRQIMGSGTYTDDASVVEACGRNIHLFPGSYNNIKITTPEDLVIAERLVEQGQERKG